MIVQAAKPAQIVVQVAGGHAVKAVEPLLEASVIGVDILDMHGSVDAQARAEVDGVVGNTRVLRELAVGRIAVTHQQRIPGQDRMQCAA